MRLHSVDRPLTETEKDVLNRAAVELVASALNVSLKQAAAALDDCAGECEVRYRADAYTASLTLDGSPLVLVSRERLALTAIDAEFHGDGHDGSPQ